MKQTLAILSLAISLFLFNVSGSKALFAADDSCPKFLSMLTGVWGAEGSFPETVVFLPQGDAPVTLHWQETLLAADNFTYVGYGDWRLPSVKELQGGIDYSGVFPAIDPLFDSTPMINEAGDLDYSYYWTNASARFQSDGSY